MKEWGVGKPSRHCSEFKGGKQFFLPLVFPVLSQDGREESSDYQEIETREITVKFAQSL